MSDARETRWARENADFLKGVFFHIDEDAPDGAWLQMHIDSVTYLQSESDIPRDLDPHDLVMAYLAATPGELP